MGKPKSLADRIAETKSQNISQNEKEKEQAILKALNKPSNRTTEQVSNRTTEQVNNRTSEQASGHLFEQESKRTSEQVNNRASEQQSNRASEQEDNRTTGQVSNRASEQVDGFCIDLKPTNLRLNQYQILFEIYFNRPFKVSGPERIGLRWKPPIAYGTVRNALLSLEKKGYISRPNSINDGVKKGTTCQVSESKCKPLFGSSSVINSEQVSKWTTEQVDNRASEQVNNRTTEQQSNRTTEQASASYMTDRQIYNNKNLSVFFKNSDYWNSQGLTLKKITSWCDEHEICTPDFLLQQLQIGEHHPKIKAASSPISYFFKSVLSGGLERPNGFEFPEEKATRLKAEEVAKQQEIIASMENTRQKERELADQESFLMFINDNEAVKAALDEITKEYMTPTMKASVNVFLKKQTIDTRLENRLRLYFQKEEKK